MVIFTPISTGQHRCFDESGNEIPCSGSGQDGAFQTGKRWPIPRFSIEGAIVHDVLTGLDWPIDANCNDFPVSWPEAFDVVNELNHCNFCGHNDWRLPNRRELHSLMSYQTKKPALPAGHPFENVFLGWYWTSTTAAINPAYAWYLHMEGARMFYGRKDQYYLVWPVRGESYVVNATGQSHCFDTGGRMISCTATGQDGAFCNGPSWPTPRFTDKDSVIYDNLTGLIWYPRGDCSSRPQSWQESLECIAELNHRRDYRRSDWRLPNINELESLVDCSRHSPALPVDHLFTQLQDVYWSSTTSFFETDWAWALYLEKGALGVGHKPGRTFYVWPVAGGV